MTQCSCGTIELGVLKDPDEYLMETSSNGTSTRMRRSLALAVDDPQAWMPEMNPPPFPDCSVVSHATMAVTSATFNFEIDYPFVL